MILQKIFGDRFTLEAEKEIRIRLKGSEAWSRGRIDSVVRNSYIVVTLFTPVDGCYGRISGEIPLVVRDIDSRGRKAIGVVNRQEYEICEVEE